jgi:hypothetical protein
MTRRAYKTKPIRPNLVRERRLTLRQAPELLMRRAKRSQIATHPGRTNTKPAPLARGGSFILCGRRDLNPHGLLRYPLKIVCLPIPPLPQLPSMSKPQGISTYILLKSYALDSRFRGNDGKGGNDDFTLSKPQGVRPTILLQV